MGELFARWRIPLVVIFLPLFVFGGGALLWVGGRFAAKLPKATYWRCVGTYVLATLLSAPACALVGAWFAITSVPALMIFGSLAQLGVGLLVTWAVIAWLLASSYAKAILAWLPTVGTGVLMIPWLVLILLPSLTRARELAKRTVCLDRLNETSEALTIYRSKNSDRFPLSLRDISGLVSSEDVLYCPSAGEGRTSDYFYMPAFLGAPGKAIVACDYRDNHQGQSRSVLFVDGATESMKETDFQSELAKTHNAVFAQALEWADPP